jgi:hypothetical protein
MTATHADFLSCPRHFPGCHDVPERTAGKATRPSDYVLGLIAIEERRCAELAAKNAPAPRPMKAPAPRPMFIVCMNTGEEFESCRAATGRYQLSLRAVYASLQRGGTTRGRIDGRVARLRFAYLDSVRAAEVAHRRQTPACWAVRCIDSGEEFPSLAAALGHAPERGRKTSTRRRHLKQAVESGGVFEGKRWARAQEGTAHCTGFRLRRSATAARKGAGK